MSPALNARNWRMTSVLNITDLQCTMKGVQVLWDIWQNGITTPTPLSLSKEQAMKLSRSLMSPPHKSNEPGLQLKYKNQRQNQNNAISAWKNQKKSSLCVNDLLYHNLSLCSSFQQNVAKQFIGMVESKRQALTQALKEIKLWLCGFVPEWSLDVTDTFLALLYRSCGILGESPSFHITSLSLKLNSACSCGFFSPALSI